MDILEKFDEFITTEAKTEARSGHSYNVPTTREPYCPNYIIQSLEDNYQEYSRNGPRPGKDYDAWTGRPITKLCDHTNCQPHAEYEFALITLVVKKEITMEQWRTHRPQTKSIVKYHLYRAKLAKDWCYGYITNHFIPKLSFEERGSTATTIECRHYDGMCVEGSAAANTLTRLVNSRNVSFQVVDQIINRGWGEKCDRACFARLDPICAFFHVDHTFDYSYLWRPFMLDEWIDMQEEEFERLLEVAKGEQTHGNKMNRSLII